MWGIFPRLAYELFKDKDDGWKVTMKYFQNVVDTVRWVKQCKCCVALRAQDVPDVWAFCMFGGDAVSSIRMWLTRLEWYIL